MLISQHADQLITDVVGLLQSTEVQVVVPAPVLVHIVLFEHIEDVEECDMVTVLVSKFRLFSVSDLDLVFGTQENIGHVQTGDDRECLVDTGVFLACHK